MSRASDTAFPPPDARQNSTLPVADEGVAHTQTVLTKEGVEAVRPTGSTLPAPGPS